MPMWLITNSQTWTAPLKGKYRIIAIGKGGDGGDGASYGYHDSQGDYYLAGRAGTSGAGGGVAISDRDINSGELLTISIDASKTTINTNKLIATVGGNGTNAAAEYYYYKQTTTLTAISAYSVPKGGTASGKWMSYGFTGGNGLLADGNVKTKVYNTTAKIETNIGGNCGCIIFSPALNGNAGIGALPSPVTNGETTYAYSYFFSSIGNSFTPSPTIECDLPCGGCAGAGGAGGGVALHHVYQYGSGSSYTSKNKTFTQGKGGIGCVLIQYLG